MSGTDADSPSTLAKAEASVVPTSPVSPSAPIVRDGGSSKTLTAERTPSTPGSSTPGTPGSTRQEEGKIPVSFKFAGQVEEDFASMYANIKELDKANSGFLDILQVKSAISRVPSLEKILPDEMVKLAMELSDTDGTRNKINHAKVSPYSLHTLPFTGNTC